MPRVLVVDDEQDYRDELGIALAHGGHEVRSAATAREAIDLGIRWQPNVLVVDWMLRNQIHGLHVVEALRSVLPDAQAILITGFGSADLRAEATRAGVFDFLEKPFDVDRIQQVVATAARTPVAVLADVAIAVADVAPDGTILHANRWARDLFADTQAGREAARLPDTLAASALPDADAALRRWVDLSPRAARAVTWHVRARTWPDGQGRLFVILRSDERERKHSHVVRLLLDLSEHAPVRWPLKGNVLIHDSSALVRRVVVAELEQAGGICHAAADVETGLRLLARDAEIRVMILDYDTPAGDIGTVAERAWAVRPDLQIVGTGTEDRREEFSIVGVHRFLPKPYVLEDLINLLTDRIAECVDCGLPLPLRRPRSDETGSGWECAGCGSRYLAVFDEDSASDVFANVRPAESVRPPE